MKKLFVVLLVLIIGGVLGAGIAYAYTHPLMTPWGSSYQTCTFKVQNTFASLTKTQFADAMIHWNGQLTKNFLFKSSEDTQDTLATRNGVKTVTKYNYGSVPWNAQTINWLDLGTNSYVVESDIEFNIYYPFANSGNYPDKWDVQSVMTHELGHTLCVDHSTVVADTMHAVPSGSEDARTVTADDRAAARDSTARWFN